METGEDGCEEAGVANRGVGYTGEAGPELLRASVIGGTPLLETGEDEGGEDAKADAEEDGVNAAPTLEIGALT